MKPFHMTHFTAVAAPASSEYLTSTLDGEVADVERERGIGDKI